jgi:hypothetical protein
VLLLRLDKDKHRLQQMNTTAQLRKGKLLTEKEQNDLDNYLKYLRRVIKYVTDESLKKNDHVHKMLHRSEIKFTDTGTSVKANEKNLNILVRRLTLAPFFEKILRSTIAHERDGMVQRVKQRISGKVPFRFILF